MIASADTVTKQADRCGGDACIRDTRIPVWSLVEARRLGASDSDLLGSYPSLTAGDLQVAWDYERRNRPEIERNIWENLAVMEFRGGDHRLALLVRGWQLGLSDEEVRDALAPPLSAAEMQDARRDYLHRNRLLDASLLELLPRELREGFNPDDAPLR